MKRSELQAILNPLMSALLDRIEAAEALATRSTPAPRVAAIRHFAELRHATAEAASLAAAIEVLAGEHQPRG